jgi:hypothetical protein
MRERCCVEEVALANPTEDDTQRISSGDGSAPKVDGSVDDSADDDAVLSDDSSEDSDCDFSLQDWEQWEDTSAFSHENLVATRVGELWVFTQDQRNGEEALVSGTADAASDCLTIDGHVVLWHSSDLDYVEELAEAVQRGEAPEILPNGGGGHQAPPEIRDRCCVTSVVVADAYYAEP